MHKFMRILPVAMVAMMLHTAQAEMAQEPLFLGGGNVPGNLAIVPSVEFPTVNSVANLDPSYNPSTAYVGAFDSGKCYDYLRPDPDRADPAAVPDPDYDPARDRHFKPVKKTANMRCPGPYWSGNYLNWATTQTIDPFRLALTGGLRVVDTPTTTWVSKARHDGQGNYFPERTVSGRDLVMDVTPFDATSIKTYIDGKGKFMEFSLTGGDTIQGDSSSGGAGIEKEQVEQVYAFSSSEESWEKYGDGNVKYDKKQWGRSRPIKKVANNDPDGGYTVFNGGAKKVDGRNFILTGWFAYEGGGGDRIRLAVSDKNANGYGPNISGGNISIERRQNGSATSISGTVNFNRKDNTWYWFEFIGNNDNTFTFTVADNEDRLNAVRVTSNVDTKYNKFERIYVHGGHVYYLDDLEVWTYKGGSGEAPKWPYDTAGGRHKAAVRVAVCVPGLLEDNCQQYAQGWKPEGLMQEYADRIRYSVFGYLNDSDWRRDGGVMRARQKFIGMRARDPQTGWADNSSSEWDSNTGVLLRNPDASDAAETAKYYGVTVSDSGAINYINKFGELNGNNFKSLDPVSELYYTATRYFRGLPQVSSYYNKSPGYSGSKSQWVDNFPVIPVNNDSWGDPLQYTCQKNVILGIGDVYTHRDQNLPGSNTSSNEPSKPSAVQSDTDVNVHQLNGFVRTLKVLIFKIIVDLGPLVMLAI